MSLGSGLALIPLEVPIQLGRDEARRLAQEELDTYTSLVDPDWVTRILQWWDQLRRWLARQAETTLPADTGGPSTGWLFAVLAVFVVAALGFLVWRVGPIRRNRRQQDAGVELAAGVSARQYRDLAERAAAAGDYQSAVRERFRSIVRELENRTVLDPRPSRTAFEVAWLASQAAPPARDALHRAASVFSDTEYGDVEALAEHYATVTALEQEILATIDRTELRDLEEATR